MPSHLLSVILWGGALSTLALAHSRHFNPNHLAVQRSAREHTASLTMEKRASSRLGSRRSKKQGTCSSNLSRTSLASSSVANETSSSSKTSSAPGFMANRTSNSSRTSSAPSSVATGTSSSSSSANATTPTFLSDLGITHFLGDNGPGIGSWFNTNSGSDSTNGHSWCLYSYDDSTNGFAPDVSAMLSNFDNDYNKAAEAFCGLEAIVTVPSGISKTMYIVDGFDHKWVRTPGSIDITKDRFAELYGSATDNKDIVIQGVIWKLTGNRSEQYKFKGNGN